MKTKKKKLKEEKDKMKIRLLFVWASVTKMLHTEMLYKRF